MQSVNLTGWAGRMTVKRMSEKTEGQTDEKPEARSHRNFGRCVTKNLPDGEILGPKFFIEVAAQSIECPGLDAGTATDTQSIANDENPVEQRQGKERSAHSACKPYAGRQRCDQSRMT